MPPDLLNQLRVDVTVSVAPGTVASVKFRDQTFMQVTAVERLTVKSVNDSTEFPAEHDVTPGSSVLFSVGFSHYDYLSKIEDYALEAYGADSYFTLSMDADNVVRLAAAQNTPSGTLVVLYAIETPIAIILCV